MKRLAAIALMIFSQVRTVHSGRGSNHQSCGSSVDRKRPVHDYHLRGKRRSSHLVTASAIAVREHSNDTGGNLVVTVALVVLAAFLASSGRIAVGPLPAFYLSFRAHAYNRSVTPSTACDEKNTAPNREFDVGSGDLGRSPSPDRRYECG